MSPPGPVTPPLSSSVRTEFNFMAGGGEMGQLIRSHDWSRTPLGTPDTWPQALRTAVHLILNTGHPMYIWWGPELICLYNDAYRRSIGSERHPGSLGQPGRAVWDEIWHIIGPEIDQVMSGRGATWRENALVPITRNGRREDVYWTYSYSPIADDDSPNGVGGVLVVCSETTDTLLARQQDRRELARFETLFQQAPGFMAVLRGPEHRFEFANPAYLKLVGHRDVIGKTVTEALPEAASQGYVALLDEVFRNGVPRSFTGASFIVRTAGAAGAVERFLDFVYQPMTDAAGQVTGIFVEGVDVTERKLAEDAVRHSEEQLRSLAQAMPNHAWTARADGKFDWFNDRIYEYSGAAVSLDDNRWLDIVHPDDVAGAIERWDRAVRTGAVYEAEFRIRRRDGRYRWHIARAVPLRSRSGTITRWIGTNTDIEDQKTAAAALAQINASLEQQVSKRTLERDRLWRNSRDLLVIVELDGTMASVNEAWTTVLGWSAEQLTGHHFAQFTHPDDLEATEAAFRFVLNQPLIEPYEYRLRHRDGSYRWFAWTAAFEDGCVYANGRHITEERERARLLEHSQEALRQAQKMEAVGQLTGGIAHDFNNMLAIVIGQLDIATRRLKRGEQGVLQYINNAAEGATRAATLTQRLLAFSRQSPLAPAVLSVNQLVATMSELLRRTLGERIVLETVLAGGLWPAHVDHNQLENAILNLAVNARDAMPEGGRLTLETANVHLDERYVALEPGLTAGQYIMISVTDEGCGMDEATLRKVFEPFFTTKPVGQGTGLGLSMVYGFVKQSGGHVRMYSEPDRGTSVKLYLPRHFGSIQEASAEVARVLPIPTSSSHAETVLVVEDDEKVRRMSCEVLRELGYTVHAAAGADEALRMFPTLDRVDIVFTDIVMAGMTGRQLAEALRSSHPTLKILYTTGYTRNAVVHNGVLDPGVALLPKPFSVEELAVKLRSVLDS